VRPLKAGGSAHGEGGPHPRRRRLPFARIWPRGVAVHAVHEGTAPRRARPRSRSREKPGGITSAASACAPRRKRRSAPSASAPPRRRTRNVSSATNASMSLREASVRISVHHLRAGSCRGRSSNPRAHDHEQHHRHAKAEVQRAWDRGRMCATSFIASARTRRRKPLQTWSSPLRGRPVGHDASFALFASGVPRVTTARNTSSSVGSADLDRELARHPKNAPVIVASAQTAGSKPHVPGRAERPPRQSRREGDAAKSRRRDRGHGPVEREESSPGTQLRLSGRWSVECTELPVRHQADAGAVTSASSM